MLEIVVQLFQNSRLRRIHEEIDKANGLLRFIICMISAHFMKLLTSFEPIYHLLSDLSHERGAHQLSSMVTPALQTPASDYDYPRSWEYDDRADDIVKWLSLFIQQDEYAVTYRK